MQYKDLLTLPLLVALITIALAVVDPGASLLIGTLFMVVLAAVVLRNTYRKHTA